MFLKNPTAARHEGGEVTTAESTRQGSAWRQHLGVLLPILLVYLTLACYRIDYQSLWLDEIFSVRDAAYIDRVVRGHLLYFAMLHVWLHLGTAEWTLRLLSVLWGAVAVCLFYATSLTLFSRRTTILGAILFATSPFLIWYSQEVRYVIVMLTTGLLMMYTFRRLLAQARPGRWLAYGSAIILSFASFITNVFLPVAQGLYLLGSPAHRSLLKKWLICFVLVVMPFGLWTGRYFLQSMLIDTTDDGEQRLSIDPSRLSTGTSKAFSPAMIPYTFLTFSAGYSQGPSVRELHVSRTLAALKPYAPTLLALGVVFGGLFCIGLIAMWRRQPDVGKFVALWIVIPILGALGVSVFTDMAYNVRYVAMALPAYVMVLAAGITRFPRPGVQVALLGIVLLINGLSLANYYVDPRYARADARSMAHYLESATQPRDVIVVVGTAVPLHYYYQGDLPILTTGDLDETARPLAEHFRELTKDYDRLWLVELRPWQKDPTGKVKAALDRAYRLLERKHFAGVDVYAYQLSH